MEIKDKEILIIPNLKHTNKKKKKKKKKKGLHWYKNYTLKIYTTMSLTKQ
jgi:hypothetical protein